MDIGNLLRIWHEIRSETLRNDVFRAFLFSNAKNNMFVGHYELTQLPIRKIINIAQKLRMPPKKVDSILKEHPELKKIEKVLSQLKSQQLQGKSRNNAI